MVSQDRFWNHQQWELEKPTGPPKMTASACFAAVSASSVSGEVDVLESRIESEVAASPQLEGSRFCQIGRS